MKCSFHTSVTSHNKARSLVKTNVRCDADSRPVGWGHITALQASKGHRFLTPESISRVPRVGSASSGRPWPHSGTPLGCTTEQGHSLPKVFPAPFCGLLCRVRLWSLKTKMPGEWRLGQRWSNLREAWKRQPPLWDGFDGNYGFVLKELEVKEGCLLHAVHKIREHTACTFIVRIFIFQLLSKCWIIVSKEHANDSINIPLL